MILFYLVRHAQKEEVFGDPALTKLGVKQAEITEEYFRNKNIQSIYSSPFKRTLQTATIIANKLNLDVQKDQRLRERMNWGDKEGETFEEFMSEWIKTDIDRKYQPSHGDSSYNAGKRMELFIDNVFQIKKSNVLVVTHGGVIGDLLRNIFSENELPLVKDEKSKAKYIEIPESSITVLKKEQNKFILGEVGSIAHLPVPLI